MIKTKVNVNSVRRDKVLVMETGCEVSEEGIEAIRTSATMAFDILRKYFEENDEKEKFEMILNIMGPMLNLKEHDAAALYLDIILNMYGFHEIAESVWHFITAHEDVENVFFERFSLETIMYYEEQISEEDEKEECAEEPVLEEENEEVEPDNTETSNASFFGDFFNDLREEQTENGDENE